MDFLIRNIQNKMPTAIQSRVADAKVKAAAFAELAAANQLVQVHIQPAYEIAQKSKKPEDVEVLVPLMDQLDKHMDKLLQILKGY